MNTPEATGTTLPHSLLQALRCLTRVLKARRVRYALIGAVATGYRSRPRFTRDLDLLLKVPQLELPILLNHLKESGFTFDVENVIREWTRDHVTALTYGDVRVDWLKPVLPCYAHILAMAEDVSWEGASLRIAHAEGLVLMKLLAFRTQDQLDIENLLAAHRGHLDLEWIRREWEAVAESDDPRMRRFEEMVKRFGGPPSTQNP